VKPETACDAIRTIVWIFSGSRISVTPDPLPAIFLAGHPQLMSIKSNRPSDSTSSAARAMESGFEP